MSQKTWKETIQINIFLVKNNNVMGKTIQTEYMQCWSQFFSCHFFFFQKYNYIIKMYLPFSLFLPFFIFVSFFFSFFQNKLSLQQSLIHIYNFFTNFFGCLNCLFTQIWSDSLNTPIYGRIQIGGLKERVCPLITPLPPHLSLTKQKYFHLPPLLSLPPSLPPTKHAHKFKI